MSNNVQSVFDAFIEADKAIKELPSLREELARRNADYDDALRIMDEDNQRINRLTQQLETLQLTLASREVALKDATFREAEVSKVLDTIRLLVPMPPAPEPVAVEQPVSVAGEVTHTENYADPLPVSTPTEAPTTSTVTSEASGNGGAASEDYASPNRFPTVSDTHDGGVYPVHGETAAGSIQPSDRPYINQSYWHKPDTMSWGEWCRGGGENAPWLAGYTDHEHNAA